MAFTKPLLCFATTGLIVLFTNNVALACDTQLSQRPTLIVSAESKKMLMHRDFAGLDRMVREYRNKNSLTSDGQPKISSFYAGISGPEHNCNERLPDAEWEEFRRLIRDWEKSSADKSAPNLALANFELAYGWHARGNGYSHTVTAEGWRLLKERTAKAQALIAKMGSKVRSDPQWYEIALEVAARQERGGKGYDALYREAIKKFPNHLDFYFAYGAYLQPKWGQSLEDFQDFVEETVRNSNEKMGRVLYTRLNWSNTDEDMFTNGQTDWQRMKLGFKTMLEDFPDAWNQNNFAKFACYAKDKDTFIKQMEVIKNDIIISAWPNLYGLNKCRYENGLPMQLKKPSN